MLRFFRINDPYRLVFVFLILILIRIGQSFYINDISIFELKWLLLGEWLGKGFSLYKETFDYTGPLAGFVYKYIDLIFGRSVFVHHMLSSFVIIIQAGIFNQLLLKNKAYAENSYLPAFLYVVLMVAVPDFMALSPQLLSLTFVLLALRNVLRRIDNQVTDELFLNSGLFTGMATMIYLPSVVFFLVFLVSLILFSTAVTRRLLLYCFGFLLIFSLCAIYFYLEGHFGAFIQSYLLKGFTISSSSLLERNDFLILCAPFFFLFLISVFKTWSAARLTNFQQKIQQVIWLMLLGGFAAFFLSNEKVGYELAFSVPVVAYFWTHYFILLRRKIARALFPGLLILGLLFFTGYSYLNFTKGLMATDAEEFEPGTMIIGEQLVGYKSIEMNSPCFNEELSKEAFEGLGYYESAGVLNDLILKADPDMIIDQLGVSDQLFRAFPMIEKNYQQIGANKFRKISN